MATRGSLGAYWALENEELIRQLEARRDGLSLAMAAERLERFGRNELREERPLLRMQVLWNQIRSPLLLLLLVAVVISVASGEWTDGLIVGLIVVATIAVGYRREYGAQAAIAALRARVAPQARVVRDGTTASIPVEQVVPGDIVLLAAGMLVPADAVVLEAVDFYVSEAVLTGESFPVEKRPSPSSVSAPLAKRGNCVFLGTNVRGGSAKCLVVATGAATEFGSIAHRLSSRPPETEFDRGIRRFGYLLTTSMLVMVLVVFAAHVLRGRPPVETLLFAVALAVGLSPELLPVILTVNLSRSANSMAKHGVLVRRLNAIENLGSLDVLCTDKTGTLTEGVVELDGAFDPSGQRDDRVLEFGAVNATLETGLASPLDDAILRAKPAGASGYAKLGEIPFDFVRKRVSVVHRKNESAELVTKGAFHHVADVCDRLSDGTALDPTTREKLERLFEDWSGRGMRVLGVAVKAVPIKPSYQRNDECGLTFAGFLTFFDRPKEGVEHALADLARLGVRVKVITGDNKLVAQHVAALVGIPHERVLTGAELDELRDESLWHVAERTDLFAEVDPHQKERILRSLKKMGHVVGFLGDGVNDAPAMHAADTSLSVEQAVDVARAAADFVLLERDLDVIRRGIEDGRRTFANTLKYVLTTTSANLANMLSMALASLALPFLPLLAGQILLNNFISDIPAIGIADDHVDPEALDRPRRWDTKFIGRFMVEFGVLSSAFDIVTFLVLLELFQAGPELFRTGWFTESLLTELVIALVVRTRRPLYRSRPGKVLLTTTLALVPVTLAIPFLPHAGVLGFVRLPLGLVGAILAITVLYVAAAELLKVWFYRDERWR